MNKQTFIESLRARLAGLPKEDIEERLDFYCEMIDDRTEEGLSEEEAIRELGPADTVASQIIADIPLVKIAKEKIKPKRKLRAWEIVLLAVGSPIWLSLLAGAIVVLLAIYAVVWSVIASLWAVFASLGACALVGVLVGIAFAIELNVLSGIAMLGAGVVCAGLGIFLFLGCLAATKGTAILTKKIALGIKKSFIRKETA